MSLGQLIKRVQQYSGLPYQESKDALIMLVEGLAARLGDRERQQFARYLPEQLQDIALSVYPMNNQYDIVAHFMYYQNIGKARAHRQIAAAWRALCDTIDRTEIEALRTGLPMKSIALFSPGKPLII